MKLSAFEDGWDLTVGKEGGVKSEVPLSVPGMPGNLKLVCPGREDTERGKT